MNINDKYNIYVGTVRGVVGNTQCKSGEQAKFDLQDVDNSGEITSMEWGRTEDEIIIGYKNGAVKLYDALLNRYTTNITDTDGKGGVVGTGAIGKNLIVARSSGHINIWKKKYIDALKVNVNDGSLDVAVCNKKRKNIIGTGGAHNDFQLWDVVTKKCIFKAKSMGHDKLNLPLPTSIRDICFFADDEKLNACVTKEGYVLLYDERVQRRPVCKFIEPKASYTSMAMAYREKQCIVGTTKGYMQLIDLRSPSKCVRTFKTFTGSVSSIVCDPVAPIVASVSLDRHLRIHDIETKELLYKEYMKQSLTKFVMKPVVKDEPAEKLEVSNVGDEEYEQLFEEMETVSEDKGKNKKRNSLNGDADDKINQGEVIKKIKGTKTRKTLKDCIDSKRKKKDIIELLSL